ncbi:trehalose-6-phosphate synthase [Acinetobacter sp.]|uniref:alpha,alpha-trehalose-phosphate synthase (UDP-forming) n=1 Tax=Acinetobacter sp. TaxID=472 RepID=UPI00264844EA|nr:trehalose-6-phosphate synthase [Acinetobacter sp.]MDN5513515.1 trehalose-6-phosphate synthase [Acinetobacter sp.]MDN5524145.1 trehalose-6-phosphate synthase [Acinetobacter sp.]
MSRLIVLSNRVSLPNPDKVTAGGLAVALQDALTDIGGVWLGWNGEKIENHQQPYFNQTEYKGVEYVTCPLTEEQYQNYYCGFANNTLWPAMHDRADLIEYQPQQYKTYQQVNRLFAQQLKKIAQPDDIIWVHDYHFFSVARYCREMGMKNRMGFFLHIPFAGIEIWNLIPTVHSLIQDLCQYDVVGLQTEHDQKKCMQVCSYYLATKPVHSQMLNCNHHPVTVKCYPIGVNPELIQKVAQQQDENTSTVFEFDGLADQQTIISVDRIDYSKGLIERFNALEIFLQNNPEYHKHLTDIQIACPCRMEIAAYKDLFEHLQSKVDLINQEFSQDDWLPINCTHDTISHDQLMKIYRQANICWVNSLRDGMNLVAKEFIAAQDPENPGVLILSKYTGAAAQMSEALIVDPESCSSMIQALKKALTMAKSERLERYQQLMNGLKLFDINDWRNAFLADLKGADEFNILPSPAKKTYHKIVNY